MIRNHPLLVFFMIRNHSLLVFGGLVLGCMKSIRARKYSFCRSCQPLQELQKLLHLSILRDSAEFRQMCCLFFLEYSLLARCFVKVVVFRTDVDDKLLDFYKFCIAVIF